MLGFCFFAASILLHEQTCTYSNEKSVAVAIASRLSRCGIRSSSARWRAKSCWDRLRQRLWPVSLPHATWERVRWATSVRWFGWPNSSTWSGTLIGPAAASAPRVAHALRRAWGVLQQADDSDGEIGGLCQVIGSEWVMSLKAAGPQKASFGETYLQVQLDDPFGCFGAVAAEAAIGEPAITRYRNAIAERWRRTKDAVLALKAERAAKLVNRKGRAVCCRPSRYAGIR